MEYYDFSPKFCNSYGGLWLETTGWKYLQALMLFLLYWLILSVAHLLQYIYGVNVQNAAFFGDNIYYSIALSAYL